MARIADRVADTTISTGTGSVTLANTAPTGYRTLAGAIGSSSQAVRYLIEGGAEWEVGVGTFNGTTGLTREVVESSSNGGALVNFSAGTKNVTLVASADMLDSAGLGTQIAVSCGYAMN